MKNHRQTNDKARAANATPTAAANTTQQLEPQTQLGLLLEHARATMAYARTLAEHELHNQNAITHMQATANANRRLIREMQTTLVDHAQFLIQLREALDEHTTTTRLAAASNNDDVSPEKPSHG